MITTNTDYSKVVKEVADMVEYVYPNRPDRKTQSNKRHQAPIINNNCSSYTQALVQFREDNCSYEPLQ